MTKFEGIKGYLLAFSAYLFWGFATIYWHYLSNISSVELLISRAIISAITLFIVITATENKKYISYIKDKKTRNALIAAAIVLCVNWGFFVYTITSGNVLQASLGYYINPLISVLLGIVVLKERLTKLQVVAVVLAFIGVVYMTVGFGVVPYLSLVLAFSFGFYGLIKKRVGLDSLNALFVETLVLSPMAIIAFGFMATKGTFTVFSANGFEIVLLLLSGVVTSLPLILFNEGAKAIPLSSIGVLQYVAPTVMLLVGVLMFGEEFTPIHAVSFCFIWAGCILYIISLVRKGKKS